MSLIKFLIQIKETPSWERKPAISDEELDKLIRKTKKGLLHRPIFQLSNKALRFVMSGNERSREHNAI